MNKIAKLQSIIADTVREARDVGLTSENDIIQYASNHPAFKKLMEDKDLKEYVEAEGVHQIASGLVDKKTPLWEKIAAMSADEAEAEQARVVQMIADGTMTDAEAEEYAEALDKAVLAYEDQAGVIRKIRRLAKATGCPKATAPASWLIQKGMLIEMADGYVFTEKAELHLT